MRETQIENHFNWRVSLCGGKSYKFRSPSNRGVADRIAFLPNGAAWLVELKRPKGGKLSELQKLFAEEMLTLKQKYVCMWTTDMIDMWAQVNCP